MVFTVFAYLENRLWIGRSRFLQFGVRFNLDQHPFVNQRPDLNHRGRGHDVVQKLTMGAPVFFPKRNVGYEHPRAHNVLETGSQTMQSTLDILQTLHALRVSIAYADKLTIITKS